MKSKNIFTKTNLSKPRSNVFDLSHERKLSGKMGRLIPIMVMDCVPGDKVSIKSNQFVRFAPLIAPVMHQVSVYCHYFFVPNRLIWPNWEGFITGGEDGMDNSVWPHIQQDLQTSATGNLFDYFGLPVGQDAINPDDPVSYLSEFSAIPFGAYQKIYNEYYRDQNLQTKSTDEVPDGLFSPTGGLTALQKRNWQHDYFTSALPWPQKGPEATIPLGDKADIVGYSDGNPPEDGFPVYHLLRDSQTGQKFTAVTPDEPLISAQINSGGNQDQTLKQQAQAAQPGDATYIDLNGTNYADLSSATAASITDLRRAVKLQEWLEKNARGGSRYTEAIYVHFGVQSPDARLQRPEFIGGCSAPIKISEVLQTSASGFPDLPADTPQGNMAGHGVSLGSSKYFSHFCQEHGYIIGIMSVMPKSAYQQGIPKHFLRRDRFAYFWPEFQHIGEQPIENQEIFAGNPDREGIFGYTPRYAEYKYINDSVHGDYRDSLDFWQMGRKFSSPPALNSDFLEMDYEEVDRIFAVQDDSDHLWCHIINDVKASRPMAYFGNPKW